MKTIFIIWIGKIDLTWGGVQRIIFILRQYLPRYGYNVQYLYSTDNYQTFHHQDGKDEERGFDVSKLRQYLIDSNCNLIIGQDAVFSHLLTDLVKKMALPNVKYVTEYHNSIFLYERTFTKQYFLFQAKKARLIKDFIINRLKYLTYPFWYKRIRWRTCANFLANYQVADAIIVLSSSETREIEKLIGKRLPKLVAIHNPLSWEKIEAPSILDNKRPEVLIVARLYNPEKRIDRALYIWKQIEQRGYTNWTLRIVGTGADESYLRKLAKRLDLKYVRFEGRQASYPYYLTASIFMMTSAVEGWGLTLTESMQTATVPIAFDSYPALHDIITDNYDGCIVHDGDINAYVNKLEWLMLNSNERKRIALNGLESCKRFIIDNYIDKWVDLLNRLF